MSVLWVIFYVRNVEFLLGSILCQAVQIGNNGRRETVDEVKKLHEWPWLPILYSWEKHRNFFIIHVGISIVYFNCFDQVRFGLPVHADVVPIVVLTYFLVPKVQSEDPVFANPTTVLSLHSVKFPSTAVRYPCFVVQNSADWQFFVISLQCCILFVDERLEPARVPVSVQLLILPVSKVLCLVDSNS